MGYEPDEITAAQAYNRTAFLIKVMMPRQISDEVW